MEYKRIVTHTDFDGIICAVLLRAQFGIDQVWFTEPWLIQQGVFSARYGDIVVDLPYAKGCSLWIDHHDTSLKDAAKGVVKVNNKSCARVVFEHFSMDDKYLELVDAADKIDTASFTKEEIKNPDAAGKLSISIRGDDRRKDNEFRQFLVNMLSTFTMEEVLAQPIVRKRVQQKMEELEVWKEQIGKYVTLHENVILVDRVDAELPRGQQFWLYITYPEKQYLLTVDSIRHDPEQIRVSVGKNIFSSGNKDLSELMATYGGGGHAAAAGCSIPKKDKKQTIATMLSWLHQ